MKRGCPEPQDYGARTAAALSTSFLGKDVPPKMHHESRSRPDHEEDKNRAEEEVIGLHKVAGPDLIGMIGQKRRPGLTLVVGRQSALYLT